jgi:archaemetzincin
VEHLEELAKEIPADKVIGVINADIFVEDMDYVFGIAQKGGKMGLVSLYRLDQRYYGKPSDYERFSSRAIREAIHELGHCYGLDHCKGKCVMQPSNDIMSVDSKPRGFCGDCRERLREAF